MLPSIMSNSNSASEEASGSSITRVQDIGSLNPMVNQTISTDDQQQPQQQPQKIKKPRCQPGRPDPDSEVIALSPRSLLTTNRYVCEVCNKGFQRDQNLQLHRRGHNLPWKLKGKSKEMTKKKVFVCPVPTCVHHNPSRALGDLTGIKKHFFRKHGEKKYQCEKCDKIYAVQSDWRAHTKACGSKEYRCACGTLFARRDSILTHRAFCDALAEETAKLTAAANPTPQQQQQPFTQYPQNPPLNFTFPDDHHHQNHQFHHQVHQPPHQFHQAHHHNQEQQQQLPMLPTNISLNTTTYHHQTPQNPNNPNSNQFHHHQITPPQITPSFYPNASSPSPTLEMFENLLGSSSNHLSATALLQQATNVGHMMNANPIMTTTQMDIGTIDAAPAVGDGIPSNYVNFPWNGDGGRSTRDFLGAHGEQFNLGGENSVGFGNGLVLNANADNNNNVNMMNNMNNINNVNMNMMNMNGMLSFTGGLGFSTAGTAYDHGRSMVKNHGSSGIGEPSARVANEPWLEMLKNLNK